MGIGDCGANIFNYFHDFVLYCCTKCFCYNHYGGILRKYQRKIIQKNDIIKVIERQSSKI